MAEIATNTNSLPNLKLFIQSQRNGLTILFYFNGQFIIVIYNPLTH